MSFTKNVKMVLSLFYMHLQMVIFETWDFSVIIIITDCWLWQTFHDYEGPVHRYLKICRNVGVVEHWSQWRMKIIEIWVGTKHLSFSSIYNSPIHRNLQKTPLSVQVVWLPPHRWSSMVHDQAFSITSIELATPIHYLDTRAGKLWRLRRGSVTNIYNNTVINKQIWKIRHVHLPFFTKINEILAQK